MEQEAMLKRLGMRRCWEIELSHEQGKGKVMMMMMMMMMIGKLNVGALLLGTLYPSQLIGCFLLIIAPVTFCFTM